MSEIGAAIAEEEKTLTTEIGRDTPKAKEVEAEIPALQGKYETSESNLDLFRLSPAEPAYSGMKEPSLEITEWENSKEFKNTQVGKKSLPLAFALVVASFVGSAATRTGTNGALAALTAGLQGFKEGSDEKWKRALHTYEQHIKFIQNNHAKYMKDVAAVDAKHHKDRVERDRELQLTMLRHGINLKGAKGEVEKLHNAITKAQARLTEIHKPTMTKTAGGGKPVGDIQKWNFAKQDLIKNGNENPSSAEITAHVKEIFPAKSGKASVDLSGLVPSKTTPKGAGNNKFTITQIGQ